MSSDTETQVVTDTPEVPGAANQVIATAAAAIAEGAPPAATPGVPGVATVPTPGVEPPPDAKESDGGPGTVTLAEENAQLITENRELLNENSNLRDEITRKDEENSALRDEIAALKNQAPAAPEKSLMDRIKAEATDVHNIIDEWFAEHFHLSKITGERADAIEFERKRVAAAVSSLKGKLGL